MHWHFRVPNWWKHLSGRSRFIISMLLIITLLVAGSILYATDILVPLPRTDTIAELPPLTPLHAYHRLAVDGKGWLWIAQDITGTAAKPKDLTQLTVVDPSAVLQAPVQARLCIDCQSTSSAKTASPFAIARIDDIAPLPGKTHAIVVAGWTTDGKPLIVQVELPPNTADCLISPACGIITPLLTIDTELPGLRSSKLQPLIKEFISIGIRPLMTLAVGRQGDIYSFWSDRGVPSLKDAGTNLIGGFQGLLHFDPVSRQWNFAYMGLAGNYTAQMQSPTSFVTAIALNRANTALYVADGDHAAIDSIDLTNSLLNSPQPYLAIQAFHKIAGVATDSQPVGVDRYQGIFGWQGDGDLAIHAHIGFIRSLAVDSAGNIFMADASNSRVRVIVPSGVIDTIGGTGADTASGDWNFPLNASFGGITAIASDRKGKLFVLEGAAVDQNGQTPVRQLSWGWLGIDHATNKATGAGSAKLTGILAGLAPHGLNEIVAQTRQTNTCTSATACVQSYLIAAGEWGIGQWLPGSLDLLPQNGLMANSNGQTSSITSSLASGIVTMVSPAKQSSLQFYNPDKTVITTALAEHSTPMTIATVQNTSMYYVFAIIQSPQGSLQFVAISIPLKPCAQLAYCVQPQSTQQLFTLDLPIQSPTGQMALSTDIVQGKGYVLLLQPTANLVSVIDISPVLGQGAAPVSAGSIQISHPASLVVSHDNGLAYVGTQSGQLFAIDTAAFLSKGIASGNALTAQQVNGALTASPITALALSSDAAHIIIAQQHDNRGTITDATVSSGIGAQLHRIGSIQTIGEVTSMALSPNNERLAALVTQGKYTSLGVWNFVDPITQQWNSVPQQIGSMHSIQSPAVLDQIGYYP